jgi:hypothetical protein
VEGVTSMRKRTEVFMPLVSRRLTLRATLPLVAVAILGIALFASAALAGKKKKSTVVVVESSSVSSGKAKQLSVSGDLNSPAACLGGRSMKLSQTDQNGAITATLATTVTGADGSWKVQVTRPTGNEFFQVKAKKRVTKRFVCRAGFSPVMPVPHPSHPPKK